PKWLQLADGRSRLDDPQDWVRREIGRALERKVPIIPVLISLDTIPDVAELPVDLKSLPDIEPLKMADQTWDRDLTILVERLDAARVIRKPPRLTKNGLRWLATLSV